MCPGLLAGFKGAAALLPVGVDIRLDIHFVCPPPIRPMVLLIRRQIIYGVHEGIVAILLAVVG